MEIVIATFIIAAGLYALIIGVAYIALYTMTLYVKHCERKYGALPVRTAPRRTP